MLARTSFKQKRHTPVAKEPRVTKWPVALAVRANAAINSVANQRPSGVRILNKSHNPGCKRLSPDSYACHARVLACISTAACGWVRPAAARRSRIASGVGVVESRTAPRLGWLVTSGCNFSLSRASKFRTTGIHSRPVFKTKNGAFIFPFLLFPDAHVFSEFFGLGLAAAIKQHRIVFSLRHFDSLAPETRGAVVSDLLSMNELYTHIVRHGQR